MRLGLHYTQWKSLVLLYFQGADGVYHFVANGVAFTPQSQYWFEYDIEKPSQGDFVAIGDYSTELTPNNIDSAEEIRQVNLLPADILRGNQLDDLHLVT